MTGADTSAEVFGPGAISIGAREFKLYQNYIERHTGIAFPDTKQDLLFGRLAPRLRQLGMRSFRAYFERVQENEREAVEMLDRISTNETHFFREERHFQFLEHCVLPLWSSTGMPGNSFRRVRVWSAGCSRGEEAYSLAMVLLQHLLPADSWEIEILATDLSQRVLHFAEEALWPMDKAEEIPPLYRKKYMLKGRGSQIGKMRAGPELRALVQFQRVNLNDQVYPISGTFDLIFCRNVLIYFTREAKGRVVSHLLDYLSPNGFFFLGHAETLTGLTDRLRTVLPGVYSRPSVRSTFGPEMNQRAVPQERLSLSRLDRQL